MAASRSCVFPSLGSCLGTCLSTCNTWTRDDTDWQPCSSSDNEPGSPEAAASMALGGEGEGG